MNQSKTCKCCGEVKPCGEFPISNKYKGHITYRNVCKPCYAGKYRSSSRREKRRDEFNKLIGWPATLLSTLAVVTAIYSHDYITGATRTCVYESVYGSHSITLDALKMCPLTYDFEI